LCTAIVPVSFRVSFVVVALTVDKTHFDHCQVALDAVSIFCEFTQARNQDRSLTTEVKGRQSNTLQRVQIKSTLNRETQRD